MLRWVLCIILSFNGFAALLKSSDRSLGEFTGRISRLNRKAGLLKVRVRFQNLRYLVRGDDVDFKLQMASHKNCRGKLMGKSNDYILLKILSAERCFKHIRFTTGAPLHFYSEDLLKNIEKGKKVVDILLKKRIALEAKKRRLQKELASYGNKTEAVGERYQILKKKLEKEWRETLDDLEKEKSIVLGRFKNAENALDDVDYKLQQYQVSDQNLELDRWSLDQNLYFKR